MRDDDRVLALKGWKRPEDEEEEEDGPVRLDRRPDERQRESDYMERRQALVERTMPVVWRVMEEIVPLDPELYAVTAKPDVAAFRRRPGLPVSARLRHGS